MCLVTPNAVQTLVAANNIDQSKFVQSDLDTTKKYWDDVFFQNHVSGDIFDAIASKSGTANAVRAKASVTDILMNVYHYIILLTAMFII